MIRKNSGKKFLTADWENLVMANYEIDPALLVPYLPFKTLLDQFNGKTFVSLVGFMFTNTRLKGVPIPFHINFEEVNLRFYVTHDVAGERKRGVVFIKEIVPKPAISYIAKKIYREKYCYMPMTNFKSVDETGLKIGYHWKFKSRWNKLEVETAANSLDMNPGSEEQFIVEHYWGYSKYDEYITSEYEVQHLSWKIFKVNSYNIDCDFEQLYGNAFGFLKDVEPSSVFMAEGSGVSVSNKKIIL